MIIEISSKKELDKFIYFVKDLYKGNEYYVYPIFSVQKKELKKLVIDDKTYKALLCERDGQIIGRLLYTYDYSKKQEKNICYFSYFDSINDDTVTNELFNHMEKDMKLNDIDYSEGTFSPFDPDTRRGIMIKGFNDMPSIFTSYNNDYYSRLLQNYGYKKAIDTVLLKADVNNLTKKKLNTFSKFFLRSNDVRVDSLDFKNLNKDLKDIEKVLKYATNDIIYQDAPDIELIKQVAKQMKAFINPDLVIIARENKTNKPIGFCLVLPDFNQVFKKTKGKIQPLRMLYYKRKITRARGQLQYVIPEYQNSGLIGHMFKVIFDNLVEAGITGFEAGTMMEDNPKSITSFKKFGGEITKIYRLYGKEL